MDHRIEMNKVLAEMQALRQRSGVNLDRPSDSVKLVPETNKSEFSQMLSNAINNVNDIQQESSRLKKAYEADEPGVNLAQVMIASQKAGIAFQATTQVRNKLVEAYRDVMNMPV